MSIQVGASDRLLLIGNPVRNDVVHASAARARETLIEKRGWVGRMGDDEIMDGLINGISGNTNL